MFERIANGWELARQSWQVLKLDKELLVFPLLSGIACLAVLASFALPLWSTGYAETLFQGDQGPQSPLAYALLFLFYLANYFVIVFFNAALVGCAIVRFKGGNPTLSDGFTVASERLPQIFAWALVSATVGLVLRVIESRSERAGRLVSGLLGTAWSVATYFVVPVLVIERLGPIETLKRSLSILRSTWGEAATGNLGLGMLTFVASLVSAIPLVAGIALVNAGSILLGALAIVVGITTVVTVSLVSSTLQAILVAALYLYAAEGTLPRAFDQARIREAFVARG